MKLKEITFDKTPRIPGLRPGDLSTLTCINPASPLRGWRAMIRGAVVFLVSPPGWTVNNQATESKLCTIHEIPRVNCYLHWEGSAEEITNVQKFDSLPFGPEPEPVVEEIDTPKVSGASAVVPPPPGGLLSQIGVGG